MITIMGAQQTPNDDTETLSDREILVRMCRQLDHIDTMIHEVDRRTGPLEQLTPHLDKALRFLDPMRKVRARKETRAGG